MSSGIQALKEAIHNYASRRAGVDPAGKFTHLQHTNEAFVNAHLEISQAQLGYQGASLWEPINADGTFPHIPGYDGPIR